MVRVQLCFVLAIAGLTLAAQCWTISCDPAFSARYIKSDAEL